MQVQFHVPLSEIAGHLHRAQYAQIVAWAMGLKNIHSVKLYKTAIDLIFNLGEGGELPLTEKAIKAEIQALWNLEPMACPCGCGAPLAIMNCLKLENETVDCKYNLTDEEKAMVDRHEKIQAIKSVRDRSKARTGESMGLKDAKDIVDAYETRNPTHVQSR